MRWPTLVVVAIAACTPQQKTVDAKSKAVTAALDKRFGAVTDFSIAGTAEQGSEKLPFTYEMKQPQFVRASIGNDSVVFDGKAMLVLDDAAKTAQKEDLSSVSEEERLMMLHQAFARFTCEGWRPPLLRPTGFAVVDDGAKWIITVPIDDAELKEQRLVLKEPGAEFVERSIVNKAGVAVTSTKVTAELVDPATKMTFPKSWESTGPDGSILKMSIDTAKVNAGVAASRFVTDVPTGYKLAP
jgi:outer membrane lipoprotein-sorting protein